MWPSPSTCASCAPVSAPRCAGGSRPTGTRPEPPKPAGPIPRQDIRFCVAQDGVRIAYAAVGQGPPLLKLANWMTHLEHDWESPVWRHWIRALSSDSRLIRYDERGNGLSDWDAADLSFEACLRDLDAVVEASGLDRFPMLGISQGCAFAVAYATRNPERVSRLVLYGGYVRGWALRGSPEEIARRQGGGGAGAGRPGAGGHPPPPSP